MNPIIPMYHFRFQATLTADEYVRRFTRFKPPKSTRLQLVTNLISEANKKIRLVEDIIMPKNKNKTTQAYGDIKFCAITLDTEGKDVARKWLAAHEKDWDTLAVAIVQSGWKTSFSWDDYNDCFIASCTQRDDGVANYNVCVTSRSENMFEALMLNIYKITVMFKEKAIPTEKEKQNWG